MISIAVGMGFLAVLVSLIFGHSLVDPDGFIGPSYLRLPTILAIAFLLDLLPRTLWGARFDPRRMGAVFRHRVRTHWTRPRLELVVSGLLCFYVTYVSYRNLKSQLPFVEGRDHTFDSELYTIDKALFFGQVPGQVFQNLLGTGISAEVLSTVYLWFLPLVPLALAAWLIWSRNLGFGYWFAVSQCVAWTLGTISYYALPTLGPGIEYPFAYINIPNTGAIQLMTSITWGRLLYINDASGSLQSIAGFASLHVAITLLMALMIQYTTTIRWLKIVFWVNACLTGVATLYFGWHYVADDVAGVAIALVAFYVGAWASHQSFTRHREPVAERVPEEVTTL